MCLTLMGWTETFLVLKSSLKTPTTRLTFPLETESPPVHQAHRGVVNLKARKIWLELYLCWLLRCLYCFSEGIITQSSTEQHVHVHLVLLSCVLKINWTVTVLLIQLVDLVPTVKGAHFLWMHWNCSIHLKIPFQHVCGSILQTVLH